MDLFGVAWRLGATLLFVVLNGFFVAAEFALVKVRVSQIAELSKQGQRSARAVTHIVEHLDLYLSSCQLGITLSSLALGALGEPAVSQLLIAGVHGAGFDLDPSASWVSVVSIIIAFAVITILHMTVGEQAPKMYALRRPEPTAMATALPLKVFTFAFRPAIGLVNRVSNWMLRLVGLPAAAHGDDAVATIEELKSIIALSASAGHIGDKEYEITQNVLRLTDLEVRHIMVPRVDAEYLSLGKPMQETLEALRKSSHTRFPLCESDLDSIIGFVHGKDILEQMIAGADLDLTGLSREHLLVPDTMALSNLLLEMQASKAQVAAVIDEHGTVTGLAFREDALEEIVGPLGDEFDDEALEFRELDDGTFDAAGNMPFPAALARLDEHCDDEGEETLGGYVVATLGRMPRRGDTAKLGRHDITVLEMGRHRIARVRISKRLESTPDQARAENGP